MITNFSEIEGEKKNLSESHEDAPEVEWKEDWGLNFKLASKL